MLSHSANTASLWTARHVLACLFLCVAVLAGYAVTYNGRFDSTDEHRLVDAANSWVRFGDWGRDESFWLGASYEFPFDRPYPILEISADEQFTASLLSWLFRVAEVLPFGQMHVLWFFNIFVTIGTVVVFFWLALMLGYEVRVAFVGALLLAFGTIIWAYSRMLFREPLAMFFVLSSATAALRWRQEGFWRGIGWGVLAMLAVIASIFAKSSALFGLPMALAMALPDRVLQVRGVRLLGDYGVLATVVLMVLVAYADGFAVGLAQHFPSEVQSRVDATYTQTALHTYLFSVGGSFWGSSPVLLAGLLGAGLLWRQGQRRVLWGVVLAIGAYAFGHAYTTGVHWFGGYSWSPRFLVPIVPLAMLLVLPVLSHMRKPAVLVLFVPLVLYSMGIQVVALASFWGEYVNLLPAKARLLSEWTHGLNNVAYLRWVLLPQSWEALGINMAWARAGLPLWAVVNVLTSMGAVVGGLWFVWRDVRYRACVGVLAGVLAILAVNNALGLRALRLQDPYYQSDKTALWQAINTLNEDDSNATVLLLPTRSYEGFILNNLRTNALRPIILDRQPGENASPQALASVRSGNSADLLAHTTVVALKRLAEHHDSLWLLADNSVFLSWAVRPIERYLAENTYFVREMPSDDPTVRLIQFYLQSQPDAWGMAHPEVSVNARFGDALVLEGFTLPEGAQARAGGFLPVALQWHAQTTLPEDIIITGFLMREGDHAVIAQWADTAPVMGFNPSYTWRAGERVRDRRAFFIPPDTPSGAYRLGVVAYRYENGVLVRYPVQGVDTLEGTIARLSPIMIEND